MCNEPRSDLIPDCPSFSLEGVFFFFTIIILGWFSLNISTCSQMVTYTTHDLSRFTRRGYLASFFFFPSSSLCLQTLATRDRDDYRAILSLNDRLSLSERYFKDPNGLPNRKWFKHVIQSPGLYLGYAADVYPGITQALRDMNMTLAESQVEVVANRINAAATYLGQ